MENKTLRVKPSEVDSCIQVLSNFGWNLTNKVIVYDKGLDLDIYTPLHYKNKYKGKIALLTFERDTDRPDYKKLHDAEIEYTSIRLDATRKPKCGAFVFGIILLIISLIFALFAVAASIGAAIGLRFIAEYAVNTFTGIINFYNNFITALAGNQITGFLLNIVLGILQRTPEDILIDVNNIDAHQIGLYTAIISCFGIGVPSLLFDFLFLFTPGSLFFLIGLLVLFIRIIKYSKAKKTNKITNIKRGKVLEVIQSE